MKKIYTYIIIIVFVVISIISFLSNDFFLFPLFFCVIPCIGSYRNQRARNTDQQSETPQQPDQEYREETIPRVEARTKGVCHNCGSTVSKENLRFCEYCGSKL